MQDRTPTGITGAVPCGNSDEDTVRTAHSPCTCMAHASLPALKAVAAAGRTLVDLARSVWAAVPGPWRSPARSNRPGRLAIVKEYLCTGSCLLGAASTLLCLATQVSARQVFEESFGGACNPHGWVVQGEKNAPDMSTPGQQKTIWDFLHGGQGFIRLTTTGMYERGSAFYTGDFVWSTEWKIDAEIHIERGADGLAFSWVDVCSNGLPDVDGITQVGQLLGGFGNYVGAPRGPVITDGLGWYDANGGYSVQFLTFSNDWITGKSYPPSATNYETTLCRNLRNWKPPIQGSVFNYLDNPGFFATNGFVRIVLMQTMTGATGCFGLTWGPTYATTNTWIVPDYPEYPAYFGVSAGTGEGIALHEVRNFVLEGDLVPEPGAWTALALTALCGCRRKQGSGSSRHRLLETGRV